MSQRMRHYPFSFRCFPYRICWDYDVPSDALGLKTTHFEMVLNPAADYTQPHEVYDHLWQRLWSVGENAIGARRGNYLATNTNSFRVRGTTAADPNWWPHPSGGYYHQLGTGGGFNSPDPAEVYLSIGHEMPVTYGLIFNIQRSSLRNVLNHYWTEGAMYAKGTLCYKPPGLLSNSTVVASFTVRRRFGYIPRPGYPIGPNNNVQTVPDTDSMHTSPVLPTIWHQGVEGETSLVHGYNAIENLINYDGFYGTTEAFHADAVAEFHDLYLQLKAVVVGFDGTFESRAAAIPNLPNVGGYGYNPTRFY